MFHFTALLCVQDSVGSSNMAGCLGFGRCSFSFPLSPISLSYLITPDILDCPLHFYCFFISGISPLLFPFSPVSLVQSLWVALYPLESFKKQTRKQTLISAKLLSIFCHLYSTKTLIPEWLFIHYYYLKPTWWFQMQGFLASILFMILFVYNGYHSPINVRCKVPSPFRHSEWCQMKAGVTYRLTH